MDHGGGGRLRDRLASLLRSTCNNTTASGACSSSTSSASSPGDAFNSKHPPPPPSACSSSRALLAADAAVARDRDSFLASSRRDFAALVGRTESFSTAVDRLHSRAPPPLSRFSLDAPPPPPPLMKTVDKSKDKSPRECFNNTHHHRLGASKIDDGVGMVRMKLLSNPYGFSTSDDDDTDVFSSDAEDPTTGRGGKKPLQVGESAAETFFCSSRSFSSDSYSSEFYTTTTKTKKKKTKNSSPAAAKKHPPVPPNNKPPRSRAKRSQHHLVASCSRRHRRAAAAGMGSCDTCGVRDGFRPVVAPASASASEQLRKGFAVVKRSRDPYADFRSSMVEMMVGRQLFAAHDMERLLRSYLSLNAPRHHPVILQAFSDIWVVLHAG